MTKAILSRKENKIFLSQKSGDRVLPSPWLLSNRKNIFDEILSESVLQTMTSMEADFAILNLFSALKLEGILRLTVPNADFYARKWLDATWSEESLRDRSSDARKSFESLWGAQESGNPRNDNYDMQQNDVFKSAYNKRRLLFLLERAGFVDVFVEGDNEELLIATAKKSMDKGERQVAADYRNIRADHKNRYEFACKKITERKILNILDLACGIGYGTLMLAKATGAKVTGVDIDQETIEYANKYYSNDKTEFICEDAKKCEFSSEHYDAIVSFETIEHVSFDQELMAIFNRSLKFGGVFICSTPNQDVMPFDANKFRFHKKHYTNDELSKLLNNAGFREVEFFMQEDPVSGNVVSGDRGCFTIAVATK